MKLSTITRNLSGIMLIMICLAGMTSCSNDHDMPEIPDLADPITIDGNGGSGNITFTSKGLKSISFSNSEGVYAETLLYSNNGQQLPANTAVSDIAKIVYESPLFLLNVEIKGSELHITSIDNTLPDYLRIEMKLDYGYATATTKIIVSPGSPIGFKSVSYDLSNAKASTEAIKSPILTASNEGASTSSLTLQPLKDAWSTTTLTPEEKWADGVTLFCNVPWYVDEKWSVNTNEEIGMWLGKPVSYHSAADPKDVTTSIDLPPHSTLKVQTVVNYQTLTAPFSMVLVQPNSKKEWTVDGTCTVKQPYDWDVVIND